MYEFIRGKLIETTLAYAVVETFGVGYKIYVPLDQTLGRWPSLGEELLLYTSFIVREQSQTLYGFLDRAQRDLFEILLTLSGVGPKMALSVVGFLTPGELVTAVQNEDLLLLSKIPGIGKKTAERLVLELKRKEKLFTTIRQSAPAAGKVADALQALINLGYERSSAEKAVREALDKLPEKSDLSELISTALKMR